MDSLEQAVCRPRSPCDRASRLVSSEWPFGPYSEGLSAPARSAIIGRRSESVTCTRNGLTCPGHPDEIVARGPDTHPHLAPRISGVVGRRYGVYREPPFAEQGPGRGNANGL